MHPIKNEPGLETKLASQSSSDVSLAFGEFMEAFEAFKETNDERLSRIENGVNVDPLTDQKMDRISRSIDKQKLRLDDLVLKQQRPGLATMGQNPAVNSEHKDAFLSYVRSGHEGDLRHIEEKALSYGSDPDGGYLVPDETSQEIGKRLSRISPIRSIAGVRTVSAAVYKKPFAVTGPASGWVNETDARPQTSSPSLGELQFPTMELYAMPAATSTLLEDAAIDVDAWIADEVETVFAEQEGAAFINGNGTSQPQGFLNVPNIVESSWSWGSLGYVLSGADGDFAPSDPSDQLIETVYSLKAGYRQNANWVMNRKVQAEIRKLKDGDGNYIWQPPASAGGSASLMGFPIVEAEDMPDIASDSLSIAFGDFRRGYLVLDRAGVSVLRDPYSAKPYVLFYMTKRVGGGVQDFDAIKLLKFGTA